MDERVKQTRRLKLVRLKRDLAVGGKLETKKKSKKKIKKKQEKNVYLMVLILGFRFFRIFRLRRDLALSGRVSDLEFYLSGA